MQRHDVASTLMRRCLNVVCPLGNVCYVDDAHEMQPLFSLKTNENDVCFNFAWRFQGNSKNPSTALSCTLKTTYLGRRRSVKF